MPNISRVVHFTGTAQQAHFSSATSPFVTCDGSNDDYELCECVSGVVVSMEGTWNERRQVVKRWMDLDKAMFKFRLGNSVPLPNMMHLQIERTQIGLQYELSTFLRS